MTLRNLIYVTGVAALIFVLGDLFAAAQLANTLGGSLNPFGVGLVQVRGGVGLLYVFLAYFSRKANDNALRQVVGPTMMWGFVAQFIPILRTFAPVVAGVGKMGYRQFATYNIVGAILWVGSMTLAGYLLGSLVPNIEKQIHYVVAGVIAVSLMPPAIAWLRRRRSKEMV